MSSARISNLVLIGSFIFSVLAGTAITALLGIEENVFIFIFLTLLIVLQEEFAYTLIGVVFALIAETLLGIHMGSLAGGFLMLILTKLVLGRIVALPSLANKKLLSFSPAMIFFLGTTCLFLGALLTLVGGIEYLLYGTDLNSWLGVLLAQPGPILLAAILQAVVLLGIFTLFSREDQD